MLTIQYAKDPVWGNEEHNLINLIVKFEEFTEEMPFAATPYDPMPYGVELFNNAVSGDYGLIAPFVPPVTIDVPTQGTQTL